MEACNTRAVRVPGSGVSCGTVGATISSPALLILERDVGAGWCRELLKRGVQSPPPVGSYLHTSLPCLHPSSAPKQEMGGVLGSTWKLIKGKPPQALGPAPQGKRAGAAALGAEGDG